MNTTGMHFTHDARRRVPLEEESAFSLVELLVVIAVISILAGLLLPALEDSRRVALRVSCCVRLRNWGQICALHADENDGALPFRVDPWGSETLEACSAVFRDAVTPYGGGMEIAYCPDGMLPEEEAASWWNSGAALLGYTYYAHMSVAASTPCPPANPRGPVRITDAVDQNDRTSLLMADVNRHHPAPLTPWHTNHHDPDEPDVWAWWFAKDARLSEGVNNCRIDGSAAWIMQEQLDKTMRHRQTNGFSNSYHWD